LYFQKTPTGYDELVLSNARYVNPSRPIGDEVKYHVLRTNINESFRSDFKSDYEGVYYVDRYYLFNSETGEVTGLIKNARQAVTDTKSLIVLAENGEFRKYTLPN